MGLFDGMGGGRQPQAAAAPAQPTPALDPVGTKPKAKKQTASFLGAASTPDSTQQSNKTLLGQ